MTLFIAGYPVAPDIARRIVATLFALNTPEATSTAQAIDRALGDASGLVALDDGQRDAVLAALVDDGGDELVAKLRGGLARDFERQAPLRGNALLLAWASVISSEGSGSTPAAGYSCKDGPNGL